MCVRACVSVRTCAFPCVVCVCVCACAWRIPQGATCFSPSFRSGNISPSLNLVHPTRPLRAVFASAVLVLAALSALLLLLNRSHLCQHCLLKWHCDQRKQRQTCVVCRSRTVMPGSSQPILAASELFQTRRLHNETERSTAQTDARKAKPRRSHLNPSGWTST